MRRAYYSDPMSSNGLIMAFWTLNGQPVTDANGHWIECDTCPCTGAVTCCADGDTLPTVYLWSYYEGTNDGGTPPLTPGCLPAVCSPSDNPGLTDGVYVSYGSFSAGPFDWNNGGFTLTGSCGCVTVQLVGSCTSREGTTALVFGVTINEDFGGGYLGPEALPNSVNITTHGELPDTSECILGLGCGFYSNGLSGGVPGDLIMDGYYITTRDPSTGIACPDGSIVSTILTFSITLLNSLGIPTLYSCDLVFAPFPSGDFFCYEWRGFLADCSAGSCTTIWLWYDPSGPLWHMRAQTHTGSSDFRTIYSGSSFPTAGTMTDNWADCGGGTTPIPAWTLALSMMSSHAVRGRSNLCEKCGAEKTKLVKCITCKGETYFKVCPNCD